MAAESGTAARFVTRESVGSVWNAKSSAGSTPICAQSVRFTDSRKNLGFRTRPSSASTRGPSSRMPSTAPADIWNPARMTSMGRASSVTITATAREVSPSGRRPKRRASSPIASTIAARQTEKADSTRPA